MSADVDHSITIPDGPEKKHQIRENIKAIRYVCFSKLMLFLCMFGNVHSADIGGLEEENANSVLIM